MLLEHRAEVRLPRRWSGGAPGDEADQGRQENGSRGCGDATEAGRAHQEPSVVSASARRSLPHRHRPDDRGSSGALLRSGQGATPSRKVRLLHQATRQGGLPHLIARRIAARQAMGMATLTELQPWLDLTDATSRRTAAAVASSREAMRERAEADRGRAVRADRFARWRGHAGGRHDGDRRCAIAGGLPQRHGEQRDPRVAKNVAAPARPRRTMSATVASGSKHDHLDELRPTITRAGLPKP